jgi:hypothetical protein
MIIELVNYVVLWLNAFPPSICVYDTYSARSIVTGTALDYAKHCKMPFGSYVEAREDLVRTHTLEEHTRGAIWLGPTANFQGSYKFMCMHTGRRITQKQFKQLSMPQSVIKLVEAMTEKD